MEDEAPITSVTPTNQLVDNRMAQDKEPEQITSIKDKETNEKLLEMVNLREELDRVEKRKNTEEILNFIRGLKDD
jgi:hypothetical protein